MRLWPVLLAGILGSLVLAAAAAFAVAAGSGAPVVVLGTPEDEPLTGRIAAELRALGIAIEVRVVAGDQRGIELEIESALREGARAAIRVDAQTGRTEVSIPDPASRQVALKQVLEGPPTAALVPVLAVRTVEFVRATLLGPRNQEQRSGRGEGGAPAGDAASPDGALAGGPGDENDGNHPLNALPAVGLALDSAAVFTPGGLSTQLMVGLVAHLSLSPHFGFELMGFTPIISGQFDDGPLSLHASTWLAAAGLFARQPLGRRFGVGAAAGGLIAVLQSTGTIDPAVALPPPGTDKATMAVASYGRMGVDFALSRNVALRLDLLGGVSVRRAVVPLDGSQDAPRRVAWSRGFASVLGGVEARWF